jgi:hypothetical protein
MSGTNGDAVAAMSCDAMYQQADVHTRRWRRAIFSLCTVEVPE